MFPKIGENIQNGWFIMENLIKMDDLGGPPLFLETPTWLLRRYPNYKIHRNGERSDNNNNPIPVAFPEILIGE